jgi:hypothetical protein
MYLYFILLGKKVLLITDECNEDPIVEMTSSSGLYSTFNSGGKQQFELHSFPGRAVFDEHDSKRLSQIAR